MPTECSGQFKDFFTEFDQSLEHLKIQGYGISVTSLEEVFLRVGSDDVQVPALVKNEEMLKVEQEDENLDKEMREYSVAE